MGVYEIDPLADDRWPDLLERHSQASVFHTRSWLGALKRTYGYEPVVYTTTAPGTPLANGWVFCRIQSWLTGRRLVSLPFSDHCVPLISTETELEQISRVVLQGKEQKRWKYIECRLPDGNPFPASFVRSDQFFLHRLNLEPQLATLFNGLHKSSTQRKIQRAEREALICEVGCSEILLDRFYRLLSLTRRRHKLPPQPRKWFSNLVACFGSELTVWVASKQETPVASIITIRFKNSLVYKYGGSDDRFFRFGGMQLLLWHAIMDAKQHGLTELDLGRSEMHDTGLSVFKDRLGATSSCLTYFRYPGDSSTIEVTSGVAWPQRLGPYIPDGLVTFGGRLLYRHFG
jgi:hypothetical protein